MVKNKKNGQTFSIDIIIVIIIILFGVLFLVINQINTQRGDDLNIIRQEALIQSDLLFSNLKKDGIIGSSNEVNLELLLQLDQEELRNQLGLGAEFAIVFERDGKLIKIDPDNNVTCVGSSNIIVNGLPCR